MNKLADLNKSPDPHSIVERLRCPQCNYSAPPHRNRSERKHFTAHWLTCDRCRYSTETQPSWETAIEAYLKPAATIISELQARLDEAQEGFTMLALEFNVRNEELAAAESSLSRIQSETVEACAKIAELPQFANVTRISVTKGPEWTDETGMAELINAHTRRIASAIRSSLTNVGEAKTAESLDSPSPLNAETE